ncbi:MAG: DUF4012 domain-containing protein [Actinobacteria bacterium]|nr:DUF4012 domain-containing protein [Actinomycetota bacterium]
MAPTGSAPTPRRPSRRELRRQHLVRRRRWRVGIVAVAVLVAVAAVLLLLDTLAARSALLDARTAIANARTAMADVDLETARQEVARARGRMADARDRTDGPIWSAVGAVPLVGRSTETFRRVVDVGAAAVAVGEAALDDAEVLVGEDGALRVSVSDGVVDLAPLREADAALGDLPVDALRAARADLAAVPATWVPGIVRDGRATALQLADEALRTLEHGRLVTTALPPFLGADGPRRYLLAMQSNGELRGTGGLLGFIAVLSADRGRLELTEPQVHEALDEAIAKRTLDPIDEPGFLTGDHTDTVPTSPEFEARYGHVAAAGFFSNVNVDPDLPTTAEVILDLYEDRTGDRLDGVIAVDPIGAEQLMSVIGPLELPDEAIDPRRPLPRRVPPAAVADVALIDIYEIAGSEHSEVRRVYSQAFAQAVFDTLLGGGWDGVAVGDQLALAAAGRHLQLFSRDEEEQAAFEALGIAGKLDAPTPAVAGAPTSDLLAVTANNATGGKQDVHLGHRISGTYRLTLVPGADGTASAWREATVRTTVVNPLPRSGMDLYIIGNCLVGTAENACFEGPPGLNRTWFTVWTPEEVAVRGATGPDGTVPLGTGRIHGEHAIDHFLETPSESENWFEVSFDGDVQLTAEGGDLTYELTWWRQAKAIPDHLDLTIEAPDGWQIAEATVAGGGSGEGMGALGDGDPVTIEVEDGRARLVGAATADVHVRVRFSKPLLRRVSDWLTSPW